MKSHVLHTVCSNMSVRLHRGNLKCITLESERVEASNYGFLSTSNWLRFLNLEFTFSLRCKLFPSEIAVSRCILVNLKFGITSCTLTKKGDVFGWYYAFGSTNAGGMFRRMPRSIDPLKRMGLYRQVLFWLVLTLRQMLYSDGQLTKYR